MKLVSKFNEKSFKNKMVKSQFDLDIKSNVETEIPDYIEHPKDFTFGVIFGNSGTGKTQFALHNYDYIYQPNWDNNKSVIDNFPGEFTEITKVLVSVGFSTPKSWLKPYSILSQGEKMRADLAMAILNDKEFIVFDEFTSVVDRTVAKTMCKVLNKRKNEFNKKFIFLTCHFDILDYLDYDWAYNFNMNKFAENSNEKKNLTSESDMEIKKSGNYLKSITI